MACYNCRCESCVNCSELATWNLKRLQQAADQRRLRQEAWNRGVMWDYTTECEPTNPDRNFFND